MPEMTTMPIFQPAASANSNSASPNPAISPANSATGSASGTLSGVEANAGKAASGAPDSFADALQRQLEQASPRDTPVADAVPLAGLTLPIQVVAEVVTEISSASLPAPVSSAVDASLDLLAAILSGAAAGLKPEPTIQDRDHGPEASSPDGPALPDGLASLASLIQSIQPNEVVRPTAGLTVDDKKTAASGLGGFLLNPASRPVVMANPDLGKEAAPAATPEFLLEAVDKSAEFAAAKSALADAASPLASRGASGDSETSFEALLTAAQAVSQHRNSGVHAAAPLPVQTPVGAHGWDGEVSDRLVWMVGRQQQRAELVLNPPQMGRIEVTIATSDGQTSALFVSANPEVRDALEAALPRLRELLADAGINLGQAQVGADSGNNAGDSSTNGAENRDNSARGPSKDELSPGNGILRQLDAPQWLKRGSGLVDIFA